MTERKLATVETITDIQPIQGADAIEVATVRGWKVVIKKNEYQVGDKCIYLEIDSWVPEELAPFLSKGKKPKEFNGIAGNRLKTVKLRGQISQGLILPITHLYGMHRDGDDVTGSLGIQKWEAPIPAQLQGVMKGNFPSFIKKTDQERAQNCWGMIKSGWCDKLVSIETKLDGSSMTVYHNNGEYGVCSRNVDLKIDQEGNSFVDTARSLDLFVKLVRFFEETGKNIALQGELMGPGIQGNRENLSKHQFFLFDIWDIDEQCYMGHDQKMVLSSMFDLDSVPVLHTKVTLSQMGIDTLDDLLNFAEGESLNNPVREGVVVKSVNGDWSFKAISNQFLLETKS